MLVLNKQAKELNIQGIRFDMGITYTDYKILAKEFTPIVNMHLVLSVSPESARQLPPISNTEGTDPQEPLLVTTETLENILDDNISIIMFEGDRVTYQIEDCVLTNINYQFGYVSVSIASNNFFKVEVFDCKVREDILS